MTMSGQNLLRALHRAGALPIVSAVSTEWMGPDRRRSLRVPLGEGLPVRIAGIGPCRLRDVSLGGGMLEVGRKLRREERYVLHVDYQGAQASLPVRAYQSDLYELFYDTGVDSRVSFHTRVVCCDASIEDLNMLYRIMRDYWSPWSEPFR
jgi:hypothetical protein